MDHLTEEVDAVFIAISLTGESSVRANTGREATPSVNNNPFDAAEIQ